MPSDPIRTCAVCRARRPQAHLLRVRWHEGEVRLTLGACPSGRSVYACPEGRCPARLLEGGRLDRGLRRPVPEAAKARLAQELEGGQR